jgi:hypothetical protein
MGVIVLLNTPRAKEVADLFVLIFQGLGYNFEDKGISFEG